MEDSQEKKNVETPVENLQEQTEQDTNNVEKVVFNTTAEVVKRVTELAHGEETPEKAEIDMLKTAFYKLHLAEREVQYKQYIDGGGDPDKYEVTPSEDENIFKAEMTLIREKRAEAIKDIRMNDKYVTFWGSCFSNFYPTTFVKLQKSLTYILNLFLHVV